MKQNSKKIKTDNKVNTYFDLLPDEINNLIYRKLLYSIITSREFQIAQSWMYHKIVTRRMSNKQRNHFSYYLDDLL
jgi:hypothetical protein